MRIDDEGLKDRNTKALRNGFVKVDENGAGVGRSPTDIERNQVIGGPSSLYEGSFGMPKLSGRYWRDVGCLPPFQ